MQHALPLDGLCSGPLFAPLVKRPAPKNHGTRMPGIRRRAAERRATPKWATHWKIRLIYAYAEMTGQSVDHVVPLTHPLVCGLHVEHNLRVLPLLDNLRKGNRFGYEQMEIVA